MATTLKQIVILTISFFYFTHGTLSQSELLGEEQYHFIYKITAKEDYSYTQFFRSAKDAEYSLRKLFKSNYTWYDNSINCFFVKTSDTLQSLSAYTQFFEQHGDVLAQPIEIYEINPSNPFPSNNYQYQYTIQLNGDFSNWKSKPIVDSAKTLFNTDAVWYNGKKNVFYVKTVSQTYSLQEYTQIIIDKGGVLSAPIQVIEINNSKTKIDEINSIVY
jgi:hypothetical protein